jgi:hypothetical protein
LISEGTLNDGFFRGLSFSLSADFLARVVFWEYAQLRTNPIVGCCGLELTMSAGSSPSALLAERPGP